MTLTRNLRYSLRPGATRTVALRLSSAGRRVLRTRRALNVVVTLRPAGGAATTRRLRLSVR